MIRHLIRSTLFTALLAATGAAWATPITVHADAEGQLLSDVSTSGFFKLASALPAGSAIRSASFVFEFHDDDDTYVEHGLETASSLSDYVQGDTRPVRGGAIATFYNRVDHHNQDLQRDYAQESASLRIGGARASGATAATQMFSNESLQLSSYYDTSTGTNTIDRWVTQLVIDYAVTTTNWTGSFSLEGTITDPEALNALIASGSLPFALDVSGDLTLAGARLILDVAEPGGQDLPEPSSAALLLAGAAGLALRRRRVK